MLQRGDYAREICYFVVIHASPFPLQPVRAVSIFLFFVCLFFGVAQALYIYIYIGSLSLYIYICKYLFFCFFFWRSTDV